MEKEKMQPGLSPVVNMGGTDFYVDTDAQVFRQADAPANTIAMKEVVNPDTQITSFAFDTRTKNVYQEILQIGHVPDYVKYVILPPMQEIIERHKEQQSAAQAQKNRLLQAPAQNTIKRRRHNQRKSIH